MATILVADDERAGRLLEYSLELTSQRDPRLLINRLCHVACEVFGVCSALAGLVGERDGVGAAVFSCGIEPQTAAGLADALLRAGLVTPALRDRRPCRLDGFAEQVGALDIAPLNPGASVALVVPILSPTEVYGWLCLLGKIGAEGFGQEDEWLAGVLAALAGRIYEGGELYAEVRRYITALEREMLERGQAEREAREAHAANERLLSCISSVLIGLDGQMRIQKWNTVAETVLGIPATQVLGRHFGEAGLAWVDERVLEGLRACHQRQQKTFLEDIAFTRPDGNRGYLGLSATPVPFADGRAPGTLLLGADLTERRLLGAQLAQAQRLESMGQLAAGIAHEINTPIQYIGDNTRFLGDSFEGLRQAVAAYAEYVDASRHGPDAAARVTALEERLADLDLPYLCAEIPPAIEQTLQGVESVAKIVRAMKEFSHPGGEAKTAVNLNRAIENTVLVSRNEWKYVAEVVTDFDAALPPVSCYPGEFNQVVLNRIINAAHAIEERRQGDAAPKGTITIGTRRLDECVQVQVRDTGCGIPEAVRARVFDPFFTTKPVGKGTGQGLALAHAIMVRRHGGTIGFESQVGEGTTFTLTLPLAAEGVPPVSRGPTWAALPAPVTQGLS
jgi:PAS domain S-box-containing protein